MKDKDFIPERGVLDKLNKINNQNLTHNCNKYPERNIKTPHPLKTDNQNLIYKPR